MRSDWVPLSASALVTGVMALVLGTLLNPGTGAESGQQTLHVVSDNSGRWLAMAVLFFGASVALTLGLPAVLTLFTRRGHALGMIGVAVFAVGAIGVSGYAMLLVFFRALVLKGAVEGANLDEVVSDNGLSIFLFGWIAAFYVGLLLVALALLRARRTPVWVPGLILLVVAMMPFGDALGRVGQALQMLALAVAFTGIAIEATSPESRDQLARDLGR